MAHWFQKQWATFTFWHIILIPLSWLFGIIVFLRKYLYQHGWLKSYRLNVPVIVVGNINIGGTGKTPLVIWLAEQMKLAGYKPGIISRGYGRLSRDLVVVNEASEDEPILMSVGANRLRRLQQVLLLREVGVWIRIIDESVQIVHRFEHCHLALLKCQIFSLLLQNEVIRLIAMVQPIELAHALAAGIVVIAIVFLSLCLRLRVAAFDEVLPLVEALQRIV